MNLCRYQLPVRHQRLLNSHQYAIPITHARSSSTNARTYSTIALGAGKSWVNSLKPSAAHIAITPAILSQNPRSKNDTIGREYRTHNEEADQSSGRSGDLHRRAAIVEDAATYYGADDNELFAVMSDGITERQESTRVSYEDHPSLEILPTLHQPCT